jgi:hypothetical protein
MSTEGASKFVYAYDGDDNVVSVMNRSGGTTVAEYEYSASWTDVGGVGNVGANGPVTSTPNPGAPPVQIANNHPTPPTAVVSPAAPRPPVTPPRPEISTVTKGLDRSGGPIAPNSGTRIAEISAQIAQLKAQTTAVFQGMAGLEANYHNAQYVGVAGLVGSVATDTAVVVGAGSAAAGAAARGYMQSALGRTLAQEVGAQAAYRVATNAGRAAFWGVSGTLVMDRTGSLGSGGTVTAPQSITGLGNKVQGFANRVANTMIENADQASREMSAELARLRSEMQPLITEYNSLLGR